MRYILLAMAFFAAFATGLALFTHLLNANDGLVGSLERRFQIIPGGTKVLPECNCTIRYLGTSVHGRRYIVVIERLD